MVLTSKHVLQIHRYLRGLHAITSYMVKSGSIHGNNTALSGELNAFYAHFEQENKDTPTQAPTTAKDSVISTSDVSATFKRVNP